ncbi:MAG: hypothetical protein IT384_26525 [Deltaproteobacteria bacterium]|nr:hypothetical protein [Deltaproteobacteria bacterium]
MALTISNEKRPILVSGGGNDDLGHLLGYSLRMGELRYNPKDHRACIVNNWGEAIRVELKINGSSQAEQTLPPGGLLFFDASALLGQRYQIALHELGSSDPYKAFYLAGDLPPAPHTSQNDRRPAGTGDSYVEQGRPVFEATRPRHTAALTDWEKKRVDEDQRTGRKDVFSAISQQSIHADSSREQFLAAMEAAGYSTYPVDQGGIGERRPLRDRQDLQPFLFMLNSDIQELETNLRQQKQGVIGYPDSPRTPNFARAWYQNADAARSALKTLTRLRDLANDAIDHRNATQNMIDYSKGYVP